MFGCGERVRSDQEVQNAVRAVSPGPRVEEGRRSFRVCQARRVPRVQDADPALRAPRAGSRPGLDAAGGFLALQREAAAAAVGAGAVPTMSSLPAAWRRKPVYAPAPGAGPRRAWCVALGSQRRRARPERRGRLGPAPAVAPPSPCLLESLETLALTVCLCQALPRRPVREGKRGSARDGGTHLQLPVAARRRRL